MQPTSGRPAMTPGVQCRKMPLLLSPLLSHREESGVNGLLEGGKQIIVSRFAGELFIQTVHPMQSCSMDGAGWLN